MKYVIAIPEAMGINPTKSKSTRYIPKGFDKKITLRDLIYDSEDEALDRMEQVISKIDYMAKDYLDMVEELHGRMKGTIIESSNKEYNMYKHIVLNGVKNLAMADIEVDKPTDLIEILRENNYGLVLARIPTEMESKLALD